MIGTVAAIVLGTAVLLYFVFREHFASALVGVAGLVIGAASLVVGVIPLFQQEPSPKEDGPHEPPKTEIIKAENAGIVQGPQIAAGRDVVLEHDPHEYGQPKFPMTQMQRPSNNEPSANKSTGQ